MKIHVKMKGLVLVTIEELKDFISETISKEFSKFAPPPPPASKEEQPILFPRMLEITGLKERSARSKIAAGEIPYYRHGE